MSQIDEIADLINQIQVLKNQLEETADNISKNADENTAKLNENFNKFETKIDTVLNKVKGLTKITNSHYMSVFGGGLFVGAVLALCSTVLLNNWINKDLIVKRAELQAQLEITKKAEAKAIEAEREFNESKKEYDSEKADYEASLKRLKLTNKDARLFFSKHGDDIKFQCWDNFCGIALPKDKVLDLNYQYTTKDQYGYEDEKDMCNEKTCTLYLKK